jgi:hypothetical protein
MKFSLAKEFEYTPAWEGNRKNPEPIVFTLRYLNSIERDEIISPGVNESGKVSIKPNYVKAFKNGVIKISRLNVNDSDVVNADEFLKLGGFYELFLEVAGKILVSSAADDPKNLQ